MIITGATFQVVVVGEVEEEEEEQEERDNIYSLSSLKFSASFSAVATSIQNDEATVCCAGRGAKRASKPQLYLVYTTLLVAAN